MTLKVVVIGGRPGTTYQVDSTNTAQSLAAAKLIITAGEDKTHCNGAAITLEGYDIRYSFTATPTAGTLGHLAGDGDLIKLQSYKSARDFKFISNVAGNHCTLTITIGF